MQSVPMILKGGSKLLDLGHGTRSERACALQMSCIRDRYFDKEFFFLYVFQSLGSSRCPLGRAVPTYLRIYGWHGRRSTRPDWRDQIDAGRPRPSSVGHSHETETPMTPAMTLVLAFSMSLDAFAAALSKGAALKRRRLFDALRTGII